MVVKRRFINEITKIGIINPFIFSSKIIGSVIADNSFIFTSVEAYCITSDMTRDIINNARNFFL
jgi:hypothetical protein